MKEFYLHHVRPLLEEDTVILCGIFLLAFFTRLYFLPSLTYDPAFLQPVVDCKEHNIWAYQLLDINNWRLMGVWYHTPGYAYFVAFVYKILGYSVVRLAVVQYVIGALVCSLMYVMTQRLINRFAALVAAFIACFFWFFIYTQSHVYSENLSMLLNLLVVYVLLFAKETWWKYFLSGFLLGLSVVVRPEVLPFAGVLFFWLLWRKLPWKDVFKNYLLFLTGVLVMFLPLMVTNYKLSGHFTIRQQTGVNFLMGSLPEYKGSNIYVTVGRKWFEVINMPYKEGNTNRSLSDPEQDAFYVAKVLNFIKEHPWAWLTFMSGKILSVLVGIDFLRSEDAYFYDQHVRGSPLSLLHTWHICVLALIGMALSARREAAKFSLLYLLLAPYFFAMFFTYKTRYLISYLPLIIVFSAYAINEIRVLILGKAWVRLSQVGLVAMFLALGVYWNPLNIVRPNQSEMYYVIGQNFDFAKDYHKAMEYFDKAIELDPDNITVIKEMAVVNMKMGHFYKARAILEDGLARFPDEFYFTVNYRALNYHESQGLPFTEANIYDQSYLDFMELYYHYFPVPYEGPVYSGAKT